MSICFIESRILFYFLFFFKENKQKINLEKKKQNKKKTKSEKGENKFSPHTPTLYPCIVLNVFNI